MKKVAKICFIAVLCCGFTFAVKQSWAAAAKTHPEAANDKSKNKDKEKNTAVSQREQERNKQVVRRVFDDLWGRGRYELIDGLYSPNCVVHSPGLKGTSLNEAVEEGKSFRTAAPDLKMTADKIEARGDIVTVEWTAKGKNTGKAAGIPATGKSVHMRGSSTFKLADGKITEVTNNYDQNELFRQLGVNPRK